MNDFDKALSIFKSDNKLYDIEKARASVNKSLPSIGIRYDNGVLLISHTWESDSRLLDKNDVRHVQKLTDNVGATFAGTPSDGMRLIDELQDYVLEDYDKFEEVADIDFHIKKLSKQMEEMSLKMTTRIFGVEILVAGYDNRNEPLLYKIDPSGNISSWSAYSIGKYQSESLDNLEENYDESINLSDAISLAMESITIDENMNYEPEDFQGCYISEEDGYNRIETKTIADNLNTGDKE